jgi:hypothetical protein
VTKERIEEAVEYLQRRGFFNHLNAAPR